ncbi:hypothetical protein O4H66_17160 [Comamonadaceae bacterium G21597-S1]|nr:hypothetical protein [Comamonadaceae bacterium G21597-S1]
MRRPTDITRMRPPERMFRGEPASRWVQDWTIAVIGLVAFFVIVHFCN